ncbi:MAG: DEAD/DEAH box helicase, partial [Thermoplasmata archaeon]|nr:DEAD/DEAH box helicase [Thermoplasmata archaeon]
MKGKKGVKGLEGLRADVSRFLLSRGIDTATGPQELSLKPILSGEDVLLIAPTGYGKTEATFGPLLQRLVEEEGKGIKLLYIAPLRALNRDMRLRMEGWCEDLGLTISVRHSDTTQNERNKQARNPPDVMVTTPETLQIMFTGSRLRKGLMNVRHVIVDEIHELHGDERGAQLDMALARLDRLTGRKVQRVGLSATVEDPEDMASFLGRRVRIITGDWKKEYNFLVDSPAVLDEDNDSSEALGCTPKMASVIRRMAELIEEHGSSLIFVNSRDLAEALTTRMKAYRPELPIGIHHGSLSREARMEMEDRFKAGELRGLFCTSSLELGMDIGRIDLVIQFKSPKEVSRLMQRGGRAGHRVGDVSKCVVLATEADDVLEAAVVAFKAKRGDLERRRARKGILTVLSNQILSMATAEGSVDMREFFSIAGNTYTFSELEWERCLELFRYLNDSHLIFVDEETGVASRG